MISHHKQINYWDFPLYLFVQWSWNRHHAQLCQ